MKSVNMVIRTPDMYALGAVCVHMYMHAHTVYIEG